MNLLLLVLAVNVYALMSDYRIDEFQKIKDFELFKFNLDSLRNLKLLKFEAFGDVFEVKLNLNNLMIGSELRHNHRGHIGKNSILRMKKSCHYHGDVKSKKSVGIAALSICPGQGIRGTIHMHGGSYTFKPSSYYLNQTHDNKMISKAHDEHLIHKLDISNSDLTFVGDKSFDIKNKLNKLLKNKNAKIHKSNGNVKNRRRLVYNGGNNILELFVVNDPYRTRIFKNSHGDLFLEKMVADVKNLVNEVSAVYENTNWGTEIGKISIKLVKMIYHESFGSAADKRMEQPTLLDCTDFWSSSCAISSSDFLNKISDYANSLEDRRWDAIAILTEKKFEGNVAGRATLGTVCSGYSRARSVNRKVTWTAGVLSHELGHNLNLGHISGDCGNGVMGAVGGITKYTLFDSCSIKTIQDFFKANSGLSCLGDLSSNGDFNAETLTPTKKPTTAKPTTPRPTEDFDRNTCYEISGLSLKSRHGKYYKSGTYGGKTKFKKDNANLYIYYNSKYTDWAIGELGNYVPGIYCTRPLLSCNGQWRIPKAKFWQSWRESSSRITPC